MDRRPITRWPYALAALLCGLLLVSCGAERFTPRPPNAESPHGEAVRLVTGEVLNFPQQQTDAKSLWALAFGGDEIGWNYPAFPNGRIETSGAFQLELPEEIGETDLQKLTVFCGAELWTSDSDALGLLIPVMVTQSNQIIAQGTSPTCLSWPSNGDVLAIRIFSDRDVRMVGRCQTSLWSRVWVDVDLQSGWNLVSAGIRGVPFQPTVDIWSAMPPARTAWYLVGQVNVQDTFHGMQREE